MNRLLNNVVPVLVWGTYHLAIPNWGMSFFSFLMMLRALIVLYLFLIRDVPERRAPVYQIVIAWVSTFLPVLMVWEPTFGSAELTGRLISISGMVLFIFTCLDLGKSFGVSPAIRTEVSNGVYRFVSHPMYLSHVIVEVGCLIANPTLWNFSIVAVAWSLFFLRAYWEKSLTRLNHLQFVA